MTALAIVGVVITAVGTGIALDTWLDATRRAPHAAEDARRTAEDDAARLRRAVAEAEVRREEAATEAQKLANERNKLVTEGAPKAHPRRTQGWGYSGSGLMLTWGTVGMVILDWDQNLAA
ncbi:hypothetical protein VTI74DRAFT_222 [Chaetomium olivicolor]